MGWIVLSLRKSELQKSISQHTLENLQLSRQIRQLSNFSNAIGDGKITPSEITSLGSLVFDDALNFMGYSKDAAIEYAQYQTDLYNTAYTDTTQAQLQNAGLALYSDGNGNLNTEALYDKFYEEALEDYAQNYIMPILNELNEDITNKKTELETQIEAERAELEQLDNSISQEIQASTIKLS